MKTLSWPTKCGPRLRVRSAAGRASRHFFEGVRVGRVGPGRTGESWRTDGTRGQNGTGRYIVASGNEKLLQISRWGKLPACHRRRHVDARTLAGTRYQPQRRKPLRVSNEIEKKKIERRKYKKSANAKNGWRRSGCGGRNERTNK